MATRTHPLSIAVNLSVRQMLASDITALVADVLERTGLHPYELCLELTESVFMEDANYFEKILASLKGLGVRLAIDDFRTGYSSLSYLKRFPVDAVKVDRSFVDGLGTDPTTPRWSAPSSPWPTRSPSKSAPRAWRPTISSPT